MPSEFSGDWIRQLSAFRPPDDRAVISGLQPVHFRCINLATIIASPFCERGGFSVDVLATWTVEERADTHGVLITTLTPSGGAAIAVISQPGASVNQGDADLMNTRCTNVLVAERPARACLDTISFSVSTTVVGSGRTYIITSNRRRGDQQVYNRVLASFRIL